MIKNINIQNFKSIINMDLPLGRFNVIIGANGCGKSTILEAISLASAAEQDKLGEEFWDNRGIRVVEPEMMLPAFDNISANGINVAVDENGSQISLYTYFDSEATKWICNKNISDQDIIKQLISARNNIDHSDTNFFRKHFPSLSDFCIYSLEESVLRYSMSNSGLRPLGRKGERLFAYLKDLSKRDEGLLIINEIKENLTVLDWFDDMEVPKDQLSMEFELRLKDQYMRETISSFDQRSANEGFLYLLFFLTLVISDETPKFFAIENIDTAFNPKLCRKIAGVLASLAQKHDKQIIMTTHNPAFLDGLDLNDETQRLFIASRNDDGYTKIKRLIKKPQSDNQPKMRLSDMWMGGYLGGVPNNF